MAAFWLGTVPVLASLGGGVQALTGKLGGRVPLITAKVENKGPLRFGREDIQVRIQGKEVTFFGNRYHKNRGVWEYSLSGEVKFVET